MRMMTVHGFAVLALGAALAIGLGTEAKAAPPANYLQGYTKIIPSDGVVEKVFYARRMARRTARRTYRRHGY